jgi:hypothetical protein
MAVNRASEQKVLENLNKSIFQIKGRTQAGIMAALLHIEQAAIAKTPVDTGNLRNSFYRKALTFKDFPSGEIGNTAKYALYVHENLKSRHAVGEAKYLENAIIENSRAILDIIISRLKV